MELHFEAVGKGPPLIILHGLLGSADNWRSMSRLLAAGHKVFALDLRNHGQSPHSNLFDYDVMVEDVREFAERQRLFSILLLGHSMGGKVAMQFALDHPELVEKLVVVDITPKTYPPMQRELLAALGALDLQQYRSFGEVDAALASQIPAAATRQFLLKNLARDQKGGMRWKIHLEAIQRNYDNLARRVASHRPFRGPALFVRGGRSGYIEDGDLPSIREMFPDAELHTIPEAGHWVHADRPREFYEIVSQFLAKG
jgi:pimeloyl-ACP methyl ester carboxylesterase